LHSRRRQNYSAHCLSANGCFLLRTGVAVSASVFTITAMSIDRYLAIRHPMSRKIINRRTTRKVSCVTDMLPPGDQIELSPTAPIKPSSSSFLHQLSPCKLNSTVSSHSQLSTQLLPLNSYLIITTNSLTLRI
jgi:hypothetical protein